MRNLVTRLGLPILIGVLVYLLGLAITGAVVQATPTNPAPRGAAAAFAAPVAADYPQFPYLDMQANVFVTATVGLPSGVPDLRAPLAGGGYTTDCCRAGLITRIYWPGPNPDQPRVTITAWTWNGVLEVYDQIDHCAIVPAPCWFAYQGPSGP